MDECRAQFLEECQFLCKQFFCFAGETCHYVDAEDYLRFSRPFHPAAYVGYPSRKEISCILPAHGGEQDIRSLLERDVEVRL